jgi:hypothetical protein
MAEQNQPTVEAQPEQLLYARILEIGMYIGLFLLFVTFALYVLRLVPAYVDHSELPRLWQLNVHDYLQTANIETGWGWLKMLRYSDFLNFLGIAILGGTTIICYLAIIPTLLKKGDKVYAFLALLEALVLILAASGILAAGH